MFGAGGDFLGVTGIEFDRQRIWIRAKIPRGTFTYDRFLGSTLYEIPRNPSRDHLASAQSAMFTALEGIDGISVDGVEAVQNGAQISLDVQFSKTGSADDLESFLFDLASPRPEGTEFESQT